MAINWNDIKKQTEQKNKDVVKELVQEKPKGVSGVFEDAFSKESYAEKFKKGDIKGGVANILGSTLLAPQSTYLNILDAIHALSHKEKPTFKHNLTGLEYQKSIAERTGDKTISERLHKIHPTVGTIGDLAYEIGTDPIELTPIGFYKDIQRAKAGSEATRGYMEAMKRGKLVPKTPVAPKKVADRTKAKVTRRPLPKKEGHFVELKFPEGVELIERSSLESASREASRLRGLGYDATTTRAKIPIRGKVQKLSTNQALGNAETMAAKIAYKPVGKSKNFRQVVQETRRRFVDDLAPIYDAEIELMGKKTTRLGTKQLPQAEKSLYKTLRLSRGSPEAANLRIKDKLEPIIRKLEKSGGTSQDLGLYAEAVHARDVNKAGISSGFTNAEVNDVIQKFGTPQMEQARKELVRYSNEMLQDLVDAGRLSQESFNVMTSKWKNYIPLNRTMEVSDLKKFDGVILGKMSDATSPVYALKGSEKSVIDPITSLIRNTFITEDAIAKGKVASQLKKFAKADASGQYIRRMKPTETVGGKNVIEALEKGQKVTYEVDPNIYKALTGLDKQSTNTLTKVLQKPAGVLRAGAIANPEFSTKNFMRDIVQAFVNSESGFNPITDFVSGMSSYLKQDALYKEFVREGGAFGAMVDIDRNAFRLAQQKIATKTYAQQFTHAMKPTTWMEGLRKISEVSEMSTRMGEYKRALKQGVSSAEAAYRARDLQDYFRKGVNVDSLNKAVAFLNANIQGKSRFVRAIQRDPLGVGTRLLGIMAVPSISAYGWNNVLANEKQRRRINDAPQWEKDTFWLWAIPGTDQVFRFPKPFEGKPVSMLTERSMDYMIENDKEAFDTFIHDLIQDQALPIMPTALLPLVEAFANHSYFMDMPVVPERFENLEYQDQFDYRTSGIAKAGAAIVRKTPLSQVPFAEKLGSPLTMQHVIRGYTAGLGGHFTDIVDVLTGQDMKPTPHITQAPGIKSVFMNPHTSGASSGFIYEESARLLKKKNSRPGEYTEEAQRKYLEYNKRFMSDYSKQIREVQNSTTLTPKQKRDELDRLYEERNEFTYKAAQEYEKFDEVAERLRKVYKDPDVLYREVNKEIYGAEEALKRFNKAVYEKAQGVVKGKVDFNVYYNTYFEVKDLESDTYKGETVAAGSINERAGRGKSKSLKTKEAIDNIKGLSDADRELLYDAFNVAKSVRVRRLVPRK